MCHGGVYLFIYCHLYSVFSIVQCSNALYRLWDGEILGHTDQPSVHEIDAHSMYNQWATAPGRSLNYPRPKSMTHLRKFSDNGVYVALPPFLVILVSDQRRRVLNPTLIDRCPGVFYKLGNDSPDMHGTNVVSEPRETHSPMLKARFLHLTILVAAGIEPATSWLPGQRVTTWPRLSKVKHIISTLVPDVTTDIPRDHIDYLGDVMSCDIFSEWDRYWTWHTKVNYWGQEVKTETLLPKTSRQV